MKAVSELDLGADFMKGLLLDRPLLAGVFLKIRKTKKTCKVPQRANQQTWGDQLSR